ncbi:DUF1129 family protein [Macrococcoides caseolyticum]|uniref:DUF1129 family protein n=1 Tax=Macrococcoides caseolyticum TaxID=69966 RepID=UPI001F1D39F2|nr:DUF1129 family protein [Macrococcus caseolyticus]MCE4955930.1 DUF1129 family protein [Macrococcus caseolyticus]
MTNLNDLNIEYVRKVNQLRPKNKEDFEYVAARITNNVTLSKDESDEIILEILEDILIAQSNSTSANEFFGHDLDQFVQDITYELPKRSMKSILMFSTFNFINVMIIMFAIFGFADFLLWISQGKHIQISILSASLCILIFLLFSLITVFFDTNAKNKTKAQNTIQALFMFLSYTIPYIIFYFIKQGPYFSFPFYFVFIILPVLIYLSLYVKRKYLPNKRFI